MKHTFEITKITIYRRQIIGLDQIHLTIKSPTPFPKFEKENPLYPARLQIDTDRGYAEEWLKEVGIDFDEIEIIDTY